LLEIAEEMQAIALSVLVSVAAAAVSEQREIR
jgi:hypothetical protein